MEKTQSQINKNLQFKIQKPPKYNVIMHNDDETTMEFVVMVLQKVFRRSFDDAERLMLQIHNEGSAIVGTYYLDIAKSKATYTMGLAQLNGYPLTLTLEEE
ncbi:MAG: ATP-dependent Clp protease adaptor ClpS [Bacteroidales bacterium]|nr:ATP-dependent Clp protease adaptor ClpS [Bacteroidales bacterium]